MSRPACILALSALLLSGCSGEDGSRLPSVSLPKVTLPTFGGGDDPAPPAASTSALPTPAGRGEDVDRSVRIVSAQDDVPTVYMALENQPGRPVSVVFAIDTAGNATPSDDPAIRLTPDAGKCNPQELTRYTFEGDETRPVFGRLQAVQGVDPTRLPEYMAVAVSRRMIDAGIARTPEDTRPQNVCTRKLWERLIVAQAQASRPASGQ